MSDAKKPQSLGNLVNEASSDVRAQHAEAAALAAQRPKASRSKQIFTLLLAAVCAGAIILQLPRFSDPYHWPNPDTDPQVTEADLIMISDLIESYRLSEGKYPETLEQVRLPEGLAERLKDSSLKYLPSGNAYVLDWTLPRWHALFNSSTGKISVEPAGKTP